MVMSQHAAEQEKQYPQFTFAAAKKQLRKPFRRWWVHSYHFSWFTIKADVYEDKKGWRWWLREARHCLKQLRHPSDVIWRDYAVRKELMPGVALRILEQHAEPEPNLIGLYVNGECVATAWWAGVSIRETAVIYGESKQSQVEYWDRLIADRRKENIFLFEENQKLEERNRQLRIENESFTRS